MSPMTRLAMMLTEMPQRRRHPRYLELFALMVGIGIASFALGWLHAATVCVEHLR
jgi:hypothetical protein